LNKYGIEIQQYGTGDIESGSLTGACTLWQFKIQATRMSN
jgi:hypothetical protein